MNNFRSATADLDQREDLRKEVANGRIQISNQATSLQAFHQESAV